MKENQLELLFISINHSQAYYQIGLTLLLRSQNEQH